MYHSRSPEPKISSVNQCIPHILWNPKVHHTFQQSPLLVPILSRRNPVHVNPRYFFQTYFIKGLYAQVVTFFRYSYQGPWISWIYFLSLENVTYALSISFFWLLLSTIFYIRQFRDSCVYFVGACGWRFINNFLTYYWEICPWRET